ncbi:MAG: hypothetical protein AAGE52_27090 [Myxococcota bacterium]
MQGISDDALAESVLRWWRLGKNENANALAATLDDHEYGQLLHRLASYRDLDDAWHFIFALVEARPAFLDEAMKALHAWTDDARLMPRHWWSEIQAGRFHEMHQLVRQLIVNDDEADVLRQRGAGQSLGGLTGLGLEVADEDLETLLALPYLSNLEVLHVRNVGPDPRALCTATLPAKTLVLQGGSPRPEILADLWTGPSFPALEELTFASLRHPIPHRRTFPEQLWENVLPVEEIAAALRGRSLARDPFYLEFKGLGIDEDAIRALAAEPAFHQLRGISLIFSPITAAQIALLEHAPLKWERLRLHLGKIEAEGAAILARAPWVTTLRDLELSSQSMGDEAAAGLLRRLAPERIALRHNQLGSRSARALASADLAELEHLDLSHNPLSDEDLAAVLRNPTLKKLVRFEALGTRFGAAAAEALVAGSFSTLEAINAGDDLPNEAAAALLGGTFPKLARLQLVGVSNETIERLRDAGLPAINARFA